MKRLTIIILLAAAAGMVSCSAVRHCKAPDVDLPERIAGAEIVKLEIPTEFEKSMEILERAVRQELPDAVISVGQAGGRAEITPERIGINLADARICDNAGSKPQEEPLAADGPAAYFSTLPLKEIVKNVQDSGSPCRISNSAGTYVCNSVMYRTLRLAETSQLGFRAGFIHVPYATEQTVTKPAGTPGMALADIARGLCAAVEAVVKYMGEG